MLGTVGACDEFSIRGAEGAHVIPQTPEHEGKAFSQLPISCPALTLEQSSTPPIAYRFLASPQLLQLQLPFLEDMTEP
jgi:hypothetical protein